MGYLIKSDFAKVITLTDLDKLTDTDDTVWTGAEKSAIEEIKSYMRNRYDTAQEFDFPPHVAANSYSLGDRVIIQYGTNAGIYKAIQDAPTSTLITDLAFWIPADTRNPKLVTVAIIILLYENYTRLNGSEIPNWLQLRYDGGDVRQSGGSIGYLKNIQKGIVQTSTPLLEAVEDGTDQSGNRIAWGAADNVVERNKSI